MNKKFLVAWVVLFVAWFIGSFIVHGVLLSADYMHLTSLFRAEGDQQKYFPWLIVAHVMLSGAFVWIYARGVESKPWLAQGVRFGIAVAFLTTVPTYIIYFAVQPMPGEVVVRQIVLSRLHSSRPCRRTSFTSPCSRCLGKWWSGRSSSTGYSPSCWEGSSPGCIEAHRHGPE